MIREILLWAPGQQALGLLVLQLLVAFVPLSMVQGSAPESSTVAGVFVYGVSDETIEGLIGGEKVSDSISLNIGDGWVSGDQFLSSLVGRTVESGNAYTIENGDRVYDSSNPTRHDDILRKGGVRFPLRVIETHPDIHMIFSRGEHQFTTEFELNQQDYDQPLVEIWTGRIGGAPIFGFVSKYVLENGVMVSNGEGGWVPAPLSENNCLLRLRGEEYLVSLVIVYSFPFD